jgi:cell division transport system permease protein
MRRIGYFFAETVQNLRRNFLMTIAAISTVAISLLLLGGVQILGMIVDNMTRSWEAKVEVSIFLRDNATENEIQTLIEDVRAMPEVADTTYLTKADAYEDFKRIYAEHPQLWESLPADALPASLRVKLHDANDAQEIELRVQGAPGVDDVNSGGVVIQRLLKVNSLLRTVTFAMSMILMIAAAALIANTIRLAIYARREEIGIMKLVGATNWFIRIPFMLEGLFAALVGAVIAGAIVVAANTLVFSKIGDTFQFLGSVFAFSSSDIGSVLIVLASVGSLVGLVGSTLALRRFLEV